MASYLADKRVCVTGGGGFLGRVVCQRLSEQGVGELIVPRSSRYDLVSAEDVADLFKTTEPNVVIHLAADAGGIGVCLKHPGRLLHANLLMGLHLLEASRRHGVGKFVLIGAAAAYPARGKPPLREADLWDGYPDQAVAPIGVAKRTLGTLLEAYRKEYGLAGVHLIPTSVYGPKDNFNLDSSHVIPAMIRKFVDAVEGGHDSVRLWGTGKVRREFLYVDDAADAIVTATARYDGADAINLSSGRDITIADVAALIAKLCDYRGGIVWDSGHPDGHPSRKLDVSRASDLLHWRAKVDLETGLKRTIEWWRSHR